MDLKNFSIKEFTIKSQCLKNNPIKDDHKKQHLVLVPKKKGPWPVVWFLPALGSHPKKHFAWKFLEKNTVEILDGQVSLKKAPMALYVFVDAFCFFGSSQFINSKGLGLYEDHLMKELAPAVKESFPVKKSSWAVMGASSGGYGALHLASRFSSTFSLSLALCPDGFFEQSLLPDLYRALTVIDSLGGVKAIHSSLKKHGLWEKKPPHSFSVLNAICMGLCYGSQGGFKIQWPIDSQSGVLKPEIWKKWKAHDPLVFLKKRKFHCQFYIEAGQFDEYQLQWASRQMASLLKCPYKEFPGGHFHLSKRYPFLWSWLEKKWKTQVKRPS